MGQGCTKARQSFIVSGSGSGDKPTVFGTQHSSSNTGDSTVASSADHHHHSSAATGGASAAAAGGGGRGKGNSNSNGKALINGILAGASRSEILASGNRRSIHLDNVISRLDPAQFNQILVTYHRISFTLAI